ncbi:hypothetical protein AAHC03_04356 [Spirometra sp. Aus1]|nr:unnamed protein product [Spirometra erinaceieuropaei]
MLRKCGFNLHISHFALLLCFLIHISHCASRTFSRVNSILLPGVDLEDLDEVDLDELDPEYKRKRFLPWAYFRHLYDTLDSPRSRKSKSHKPFRFG